jgi:hypothetical protein
MILINGRTYHLCLLDTNATSEMLKNPKLEFRLFCEWAFPRTPTYVPTFSLFTVIELRRRRDLYAKFLGVFGVFPCIVLKGHEELILDEMASYPDPSKVSAVSVGFGGLAATPDRRLDRALETLFAQPDIREKESTWLAGRADIVEGITDLVKNYPPEKQAYTPREVRRFLEIAVFQQIAMRSPDFARKIHSTGETVLIDAFPSLKMTLLTAFHKFYVDSRKPSVSDTFDLLISAPTPYVDAVVTENHQAEAIRKIKRLDPFLNHLTVKTLRDFRA